MLDEESVKAKIATLTSTEQSGAKLFIGDPISFTANTVTIGSGRKPRAKKEPAAAKRKKALPETNGHKNAVTV
jgi:hypothetical protein